MRKTEINREDALAIDWDALPPINKERMSKAHVQKILKAQTSSFVCHPSVKRDMIQEDGTSKPVRCVVVELSAFSKEVYKSLQKGIKYVLVAMFNLKFLATFTLTQ